MLPKANHKAVPETKDTHNGKSKCNVFLIFHYDIPIKRSSKSNLLQLVIYGFWWTPHSIILSTHKLSITYSECRPNLMLIKMVQTYSTTLFLFKKLLGKYLSINLNFCAKGMSWTNKDTLFMRRKYMGFVMCFCCSCFFLQKTLDWFWINLWIIHLVSSSNDIHFLLFGTRFKLEVKN